MTRVLIGAFSAIALGFATVATADEAFMPQPPGSPDNPAFVDQLPESILVAPSEPKARRTAPRRTPAKARPKAPARSAPARREIVAIFPSVGAGATAAVQPAKRDMHFPSVGEGTVGR